MVIHGAAEPGRDRLSWAHGIDRALVHRDAIAEVLLTDSARRGKDRFVVAAQWPRSHRVYRPDPVGRHDPMVLLETVRQVALAVSHTEYGVPMTHTSIMRDIGFRLTPRDEPRARQAASNITIDLRCAEVVQRAGQLRGMTVLLVFACEGRAFGTGWGGIRWVSRATFTALRASAKNANRLLSAADGQPGTPCATVFRSAADALITEENRHGTRRRLVVPLAHPVYFDHPVDHVPGMLLLDAVWQAASDTVPTGSRLVECAMQCPAFTELRGETWISVQADGASRFAFEVTQDNRTTATGHLVVALPEVDGWTR